MRKVAALVAAGLVLAGCSSTVQGVASPAGPDGSQNYASVKDLYEDIVAGGTDCGNFQEESSSGIAEEAGNCELGGGDQLVLTLWKDAAARDDGLSQLEDTLDSIEVDYCFVVGRGDSGTWLVNAGDAPDVCRAVAADLGGQIDRSAGS
ncbi:hypothetical protein [Petropleomorpha daqingensis]|uniref:Uncharacterized protein YceK n=1 Tax=Petropleomorpha daqingensis TaxID=2026353 RepID=A0A853CGU8_9ACTN|nr:hypothetical protein [Petropleomorpha daqingensis]NYJ06401.1 uncharacterized protein YceK [Petropleomorpha daqingensis]